MGRTRTVIIVALAAATPGIVMRAAGIHIGTLPDTALFGLSIVAAAFLLSWGAEASEMDIAQGLAVAFIALIAVLPEYAVSMTFAWNAANDPAVCHTGQQVAEGIQCNGQYALANMTGGNRLLIGAAWPLIVFLFWKRTGRRVLHMERSYALEVVALSAATVYSFVIPIKGDIALYDTVILGAIFLAYVSVVARAPAEEPELVGPARTIGNLPTRQRRSTVAFLLLFSAASIFASAEPFAHGLVHVGTDFGVDEFLLVQWLAPFASEAPEFLVTAILAWRGRAAVAMGALLSSKVNQWTLLVGGLPLVFAISGGHIDPLVIDTRQREEVLLTAGQSLFAVAVLVNLSLSTREAMLLFGLFFVQFVIPITEVRWVIAGVYVLLGLGLALRELSDIRALIATAVRVFKDPAGGGLLPGEVEAEHAQDVSG